MDELRQLLSQAHDDLEPWVMGKIPKHFKRITVDMKTAKRLAVLGQQKMATYFGEDDNPMKLYFCQAVIVGAIFSGEYDNITICTPSQYGKSYILGHTALGLAYEGNQTYTAAATTKITEVLMDQTVRAVSESHPTIQAELAKSNKTSIERLTTSLSRQKISFPPRGKELGGFVESITFGDTFSDKSKSGAVGRTGIMFIDEGIIMEEGSPEEIFNSPKNPHLRDFLSKVL